VKSGLARRPLGTTATAGEARARTLLDGVPEQVLARLVAGDPLELRGRVTARLRERALLCDAERVILRALALVAQQARAADTASDVEDWLAERVDEGIEQSLDEDQGLWNETAPARSSPWRVFAAPLGLDAAALREGCARFNGLALEQREAFFLLVMDGASGDEACRARGISLSELARRARAGLDVLRSAVAPEPTPCR